MTTKRRVVFQFDDSSRVSMETIRARLRLEESDFTEVKIMRDGKVDVLLIPHVEKIKFP